MSQPRLNIGVGFSLPMDAVTQTFAILAKRGVGKTYLASVMAEEMLAAKQQIIALDPTGAWWGLKSDFEIAVFGGDHGDLPLTESAGETVAAAIVEGGFSAVLDLSLLRKGQMIRFMVGFLETLYRINRNAVHVFVDEADAFAPQTSRGQGVDEMKMLGAMEDLVRRGRKRGLGCTMITQRPAVLNKNVLTQAECLVAMRLVHPKDVNAIDEWVALHGDPKTAKAMRDSLPSLGVGEAWFWSPAWGNLFEQVKIRHRKTFDSGATPKPGQAAAKPKKLTPIDLAKLGDRIRTAVETAKANDPATLKAEISKLKSQIATLEKQLAAKPTAAAGKEKRVEVPILTAKERASIDRAEKTLVQFVEKSGELQQALGLISRAKATARNNPVNNTHTVLQTADPTKPTFLSMKLSTPRPAAAPGPAPGPSSNGDVPGQPLPKASRLILTALVQHGPAAKSKIAILAGYAVNGGGFKNALGALRSAGFVSDSTDGTLAATSDGVEALGVVKPLPTGQALIDQWLQDLPKAESLILGHLCANFPTELSKEDVAQAVGYEANGGGFKNALGRLRTLELVEGKNALKASDSLFA